MTEDIDKELEDLAGDLDLGDDFDLGDDLGADAAGDDSMDLGGDPGEGEDSGEGGDDLNLDAELQSMLDQESGGGEDSPADDAFEESPAAAPAAKAAPAPPPALPPMPDLTEGQTVNLEFLLDIKLHVTFEVGRSKMLISDLLTLGQGSVIELHRLVGDELDMLVNGRLIAKGEVIVINEKFGCKITEIIAPQERVKHLGGI